MLSCIDRVCSETVRQHDPSACGLLEECLALKGRTEHAKYYKVKKLPRIFA